MSVKERIKFVRANYANRFTLPVLYDWQQEKLNKYLEDTPEEEREANRRDFIEKNHELRLVVARLSDQEKREADVSAAKEMEATKGGHLTYLSAYQQFIWPKIREKIQKGLERGEDGTFAEFDRDTLDEYLDTIEKFSLAEVQFIIRAYNDAEKVAKEQAEANPNFTGMASEKGSSTE